MANLSNINNKFLVTTGGDVGIGSTSPTAKLEVVCANGENALRANFGSSADIFMGFDNANPYLILQDNGNTTTHNFKSNDTHNYIVGSNLGIGTASPARPLSVNSSQISARFTSSSADSQIEIIDSSGTIVFGSSSGNAIVQAGGAERVRIDSSGDLTIQGGRIYVKESDLGNNAVAITRDADEGYVQLFSSGSQTIEIRGNGNSYFNGGNVGIGTSSPTEKLVVQDGKVLAGHTNARGYGFHDLSNYTYTANTGRLSLVSNGAEAVSIDSSQNVGIGTTSPAVKLHVHATSGDGLIRITGDNIINSGGTIKGFNNGLAFNVAASGGGSETEAIRIIGNGNVGIGTTSPSERLSVDGNAKIFKGDDARVTITDVGDSSTILLRSDGANTSIGTSSNHDLQIHTNDSEKMRIDSSGFVIHKGPTGSGTNLQESWYYGTDSNFRLDLKQIVSSGLVKHSFNIVNNGASYNNNLVLDRGNVGIGTTSPGAKLHNYSTATQNVWISGYGTLAQNDWGAGHAIFAAQDNGLLISKANASNNTNRLFSFYHDSGGNSEFYMYDTNSNNKVKIDSSGDTFFNGGSVGIGKTNPSTHLDVQGVITAGDSTTDGAIRRQHQTFATMKPGPSSGGNVDMMFVDHTHSLDITVVAYINTSNVATGRGYSVAAYGSASAGLTQTSFAGNVSALSISYVNTGGSENYILRVTCTYSGVDAPSISVTANGQSTSELRAAT